VGQDGKAYGRDELDPLLWPGSKYLLAEPRNREAIGLLDEFLAKHGEKMIKDPLKRAFLQRDLWAIFDWFADPDAEYQLETRRLMAERRASRVRLAQVIRRLALSADQIQELPDNYAAAVAAKTLPTQHDPSRPEEAFLPPNLMESNGPWVMLADTGDIVVAPQHTHFTRGRSAFFVLMNLPAGRKATLDYLEKLRTFPNPLMPRPVDRGGRFAGKFGPVLNPELPQFPVGTQVALCREMLLIDTQGTITPTRLVESLQLRVYRDIPKADPAKLDQFDRLISKQDFYEFRLRREGLFAGKAGGLRVVGPKDPEFGTFRSHAVEPFEKLKPSDLSARSHPILDSCTACHGAETNAGPGIHSVLTYNRGFSVPPDLVESKRKNQDSGAKLWKQRHYSWGLLQGLLENQLRK
jgi:hypothetical protein